MILGNLDLVTALPFGTTRVPLLQTNLKSDQAPTVGEVLNTSEVASFSS
jgi:hypothetical protein